MGDAAPGRTGAGARRPIKPPRLGPGSVIGIAAPAGPFDPQRLQQGVAVLNALGFEVVVPEGLSAAQGFLAGADAHRAHILNRLFADPGIDAVMCARGGYGSLRILPLLRYALLAAAPKVVIGFSDITALLAAVSRRSRLVVFHGPVVTTLADASQKTVAGMLAAIASDRPLAVRSESAVPLRAGRAAAPVCGGNLTTLCHLVGTPFAPRFRNRIVFLEDCGEAPYRIDRMLVHLRAAGCFEGVKGLVLGSFEACGERAEIQALVADVFKDAPFPILAGVDAGHAEPNLTLPLGVRAVLDAGACRLTFECATSGSNA
ncbi:MAG: LD-carboxypeptidase [Desulfobacterales bacterium]|jgi:muramoyltetrapeptide carboxypeptidase|nr:LD-carboxypeptidase [Desulfobacterales bacterium]